MRGQQTSFRLATGWSEGREGKAFGSTLEVGDDRAQQRKQLKRDCNKDKEMIRLVGHVETDLDTGTVLLDGLYLWFCIAKFSSLFIE